MKFLFVFSFLINFLNLNIKANKAEFYDFIKLGLVLFLSSVVFGLMIAEQSYLLWLIRENILLLGIMFIMLFMGIKVRFEMVLIYFIFVVNILHVAQGLIGYREPMFYEFIDLLLLPGADREITEYSAGTLGALIYSQTGIYYNVPQKKNQHKNYFYS